MTTRAVIAFRIKPECIEQTRALFSLQNGEISSRMGLTSNGVYLLDNLVIRIIEHDLDPEELAEKLAKGHQHVKEFEDKLNEVLELPRDLLNTEGVKNYQSVVTMEEIFSWRRSEELVADGAR